MRSELRALLVGASLIFLSGCATNGTGALPYMGGKDNFGEANRQTMAAQIVDPNPDYGTAIPETHGEHAGQAVERYRTDKVKMPERIRTSKSGSGGGGGGGN